MRSLTLCLILAIMAFEDNPDFAEKTGLDSNPVKLSQVKF